MAALTTRVSLLDPKRLDLLNLRVKEVNANLERQAALRQQQPAAAAEMDQKVWKGSFFFWGGDMDPGAADTGRLGPRGRRVRARRSTLCMSDWNGGTRW